MLVYLNADLNGQIAYVLMSVVTPYSSFATRKENMIQVFGLFARHKPAVGRKIKIVERIRDDVTLTRFFWNVVLGLLGVGTLPGFKIWAPMGKDGHMRNAELARMSNDHTIEEEPE